MVTVNIVLQHTRHAWYVIAYHANFADGSHDPLPLPPTRMFITEKAAINYVRRVVLRRLNLVRKDATGTDIVSHVTIEPLRK